MPVSLPYSEFPVPASAPFPNGQKACRPLVLAQIKGSNGNQFTCIACLDSGADHCVFPLSFAVALGLDPLQMKAQMTSGIGNIANMTYYDTIEIEIPNTPLSFSTLAGFTQGLDALGMGLLGQFGFFDHYTVTFDHRARLFHIEK